MSVRPLCVEPHPVLRRQARPVESFTKDLRRLARDMIETMYANEGIGLAAPQIGEDVRIFVANAAQRRGQEVVVVNPVLEAMNGRIAITEGCLSVPNVWEKVKRASRVRVSGQDLDGKPLALEADGLPAIIFQHEIDHLQGQLFIDRLSWFHKFRVAKLRFTSRMDAGESQSGVGCYARDLFWNGGLCRSKP